MGHVVQFTTQSSSWVIRKQPLCDINTRSSACLACCIKPESVESLDLRPKNQTVRNQIKKTSSISRDYWTSVSEMENRAVQSQASISSINTSTQPLDTHPDVSSSNSHSEFVNHGLNLWNQTRQRWVGCKKQNSKGQQIREPKLSWNTTYESLLGSNKPFSQPVPLPEMVDFLVDIWEQEGMYD